MRTVGLSLALALAACGPLSTPDSARLCKLPSEIDLAEALGGPPVRDAVDAADQGAAQCAWSAAPDGGRPRTLSITLLQADSTPEGSAQALFTQELHALEAEFTATRIVGGLGEAAVMGFGNVGDAGFSGGLIARDGKSVVVMRIEGVDPAAFERVGRSIVAKL